MRLILADDAVLFREALAAALAADGHEILGQVGDGEALLRLAERTSPDLAIVDIRMPPGHRREGLDAALVLRARQPRVPVLLLSHHVETADVASLLRDDAAGVGYLLKDRVGRLSDLLEAVRRVGNGGTAIDPEVVGRLLGRRREPGPLDELTAREREVLALMAEGRSNQAIADRLVLEARTIEGHVRTIFSKLRLEPAPDDHRRVLAVLLWLRRTASADG
jgi:DNA-binding NarL/FixJ family response regulator